MPVKTAEQLREKTDRLKKRLTEKADGMEGSALRALKKEIRRAQRRRRKIETAEAKVKAKAPAAAPAAGAPAGAPAAAEETKAE